ncbi:MAG: hybrid sensor histidine kinase/response regulator [Leptolyngbya sp.]|nr:MAG: hybrid sensor histidine kinase/response regulator [Leptolyngbya sp.]
MLLPNICLSELVYFVPVFPNTVTIQVALTALSRSQCDRLIILDSQQQPMGVVKLHRLLPQLLLSSESPASLSPLALPPILAAPITAIAPSVIEPIILVPAEWQLSQLMMRVQLPDSEAIALINGTGEVLGLLDIERVFQLFTEEPTASDPTEIASAPYLPAFLSPVPQDAPTSIHSDPQQRQIIQLTQQLFAQRAELEQRLKTQQNEINQLRQQNQPISLNPSSSSTQLTALSAPPSQAALFNSLLELLERLPLPLMLQTQSGTVLAQNSTWRSQVGDLLDPGWIRQEASQLLGELDANPSLADPNLCYLGTSPDSCVCLCPLKDGQERVLQFIKIPLCTLLPGWNLDWSNPLSQTAPPLFSQTSPSQVGSFRLADLTSDANPSSTETGESSNASLSRYAGSQSTLVDEPWQKTLEIGTEALWLVQAQDVTEQQQLAHELTAKNADLIQLNRLKDEFLACISHELKTPLTAVLGLSSLLKDQTLGELNPRQVRYAQLIYQSSRHLMTVVNDILDLTRIETGQLQLLFAPVQIEVVCAQAFEQAKQLRFLESKSEDPPTDEQLTAQFSLEITPGLDIFVADELRLRQMLIHLLSNALKFTEPGKPIGLKVNRWGGWIAFTVWDQGIGIPAEKQHLIFQKFQQLENPLTRQFEGAGLGLVLTRRLARLHGGDVTFLSKEDEGSQFTVLLPPLPPNKAPFSYQDEAEDGNGLAESGEWLGGRSPIYLPPDRFRADIQPGVSGSVRRDRLILIVEGVPQAIETLSDQLGSLGYRVVIARSGTEALEKARRLQPCIIFLNPLLPLLSGWDVLTLLKSNTETQHLPVVVMSTQVEEAAAYRCHANGFMNLPIQIKVLEQTLKTLLIETESPIFRDRPITNLTILRLYLDAPSDRDSTPLEDLNHLLQSHRYRILESDDLEQAELLARVWKPHVVLLEGSLSAPADYLKQLSHYPSLSALPLVTLDSAVTQAASQIPGLLVFPYLAPATTTFSEEVIPATLLQVLQIAASSAWQPSVLAVDISTLLMATDPVAATIHATLETLPNSPKQVEWLQALTHYLQTAGLRSEIKQSWQEVMQQIQAQSVDLLLICWTSDAPESDAIALLSSLESLDQPPPMLILDHRHHQASSTPAPLPDRITQLATQVLVAPTNMTDLLKEIHWAMRKDPSGD